MKFTDWHFWRETLRQTTAAAALTAIFALPLTTNAQSMTKPQTSRRTSSTIKIKALTEDQKIIHVLNRLGYGARPGDIEKVKQIGLNKYIELQLNPTIIDDAVAELKVKDFDALKISNEELFAKYPSPAAVLQLVAQNNGINPKQLRGDLKTYKI